MGHQIYQKSDLNFPKSLFLLSKLENLYVQVMAVLMPLEIKHHTVPHFKPLTRCIDYASEHGCGGTFKHHLTVFKSTILSLNSKF